MNRVMVSIVGLVEMPSVVQNSKYAMRALLYLAFVEVAREASASVLARASCTSLLDEGGCSGWLG